MEIALSKCVRISLSAVLLVHNTLLMSDGDMVLCPHAYRNLFRDRLQEISGNLGSDVDRWLADDHQVLYVRTQSTFRRNDQPIHKRRHDERHLQRLLGPVSAHPRRLQFRSARPSSETARRNQQR